MRALSLKIATNAPLIAPTAMATPMAATTAGNNCSSWPPDTASSVVDDSVMMAGTERSMPRPMMTMAWPIAAMARNAANGSTARIAPG